MESWLSGRRRTIGNRVTANTRSRVRIPLSPPKQKDILSDVLLFWVSLPEGRLYPLVFECSGWQSHPRAKVFVCGEHACTAQKRRRPEGRLSGSPIPFRDFKISILTLPSKKKDPLFSGSFFLGFAGCWPAPRYQKRGGHLADVLLVFL